MDEKIRRVCQSFEGVTFDVDINTLNQDHQKAEEDRVSSRSIITQSKMTFRDYLEQANKKGKADVSVFKVFNLFVLRQKSISMHMNMLKQNGTFFSGLVWAPKAYDFYN